jgi:hypothetical protein
LAVKRAALVRWQHARCARYTVQGLAPGAVYQFRVVSFRQADDETSREYLHATEDLRGAFQIDPP